MRVGVCPTPRLAAPSAPQHAWHRSRRAEAAADPADSLCASSAARRRCRSPAPAPPPPFGSAGPPKLKLRSRGSARRSARAEADLNAAEAAALEARLGVSPAELPPSLRLYGLQRRHPASFSGPGLLPGEQDSGAVEYKLRLQAEPGTPRFEGLVTQLTWRLSEGGGACLYALGVEDNGCPRGLEEPELQASLDVLHAMAARAHATATVLQTPPGAAAGRRCAVVRICQAPSPAAAAAASGLRVAVAGGVGAGKSTLVAVLSNGGGGAPALDDGRGSSRTAVLRHKHELLSGHTSSLSVQQVAYAADGERVGNGAARAVMAAGGGLLLQCMGAVPTPALPPSPTRTGAVLNYTGLPCVSPAGLGADAVQLATLLDLGGHESVQHTTLHGLTTLLPNCMLLCVSAADGGEGALLGRAPCCAGGAGAAVVSSLAAALKAVWLVS